MDTTKVSCYLKYRIHATPGKAVYILGAMALDAEPILVTRWWQVGRFRASPYKPVVESVSDLDGREVQPSSLGGGCFHEPQSGYYFWLINEGQTKACRTDEEAIPPPKTKCQTRWYNGRWQKLYKRRGWVDA